MKIKTLYEFNQQQVEHIEKVYSAKFICETVSKDQYGNWYNMPMMLFFQEKAHPDGSNWFMIHFSGERGFISNGISAIEPDNSLFGIKTTDGIIYSPYRHRMVVASDGQFIDGGRDYVKSSAPVVEMKITSDGLVLC